MQVGNLVKSNIQTYSHSAHAKEFEGNEAEALKKNVSTGTLHIENALAAAKIASKYNIKDISPRDMVEMSEKLYQAGIISPEENGILSFQPELHSDYNEIIGKKTGTEAKPDGRRDYIQIWKEKIQIYKETGNGAGVASSSQILNILENLSVISMQ